MSARRFGLASLALMGALAMPAIASAAPKDGCPDATIWSRMTVTEAAEEIFPNLLPGLYPWTSAGELADFLDALENRNGDAFLCLRTTWGDHLNPNSKWYLVGVDALGAPTILYTVRDNNSND